MLGRILKGYGIFDVAVEAAKTGRPDGSSEYSVNTVEDLYAKVIPLVGELDRANKRPSQARVAEKIGCDEDTLRRWVRELAGCSDWRVFLKTVPRQVKKGR